MEAFLTVNSGSSSLKLGLFAEDLSTLAMCHVDRIGRREAAMKIRDAAGAALPMPDHAPKAFATNTQALRTALEVFQADFPGLEVIGIGHRVVHGGISHGEPVRLTEVVMKELARLAPFAPLHQPHNLAGVRAASELFGLVPQVACFDTAFHRGHPFVNDAYALPRKYYEQGVRRYGFHGLSYDYIAGTLAQTDPDLHAGKVVVAHLGSGASMCAISGGKSIDSSMGFTVLDGLPMGTRTGQLDPGVMLYMLQTEGMDAGQLTDLVYKQSGLLGLSGVSNDMRTLETSDDPHAAEAIAYFCARIRREVAGLAASMGGLDGLVFCGGIGENSSRVRAEVCEGLDWLGVSIDGDRNVQGARDFGTGKVRVMMIPTNEEIIIARAAKKVLAS
ncbi:acetate/propionate family kinase [Paenirhodobacter sp.]|uniref:acetate/propionate family kinase n=1 Tax=Paenirhodobacter sp. TaxID=1965326 RepID=UPI003B3EA75E